MIYIEFIEPTDDHWNDWKLRCQKATEDLIDDISKGKSYKISNLYKEMKDVYFDRDKNFYSKCAYCECLVIVNQYGDIEHFRPKNRITDINNNIIKKKDGNIHPGYYWLAYDISNLLPSCILCNRPSTYKKTKKIGKGNKFPVKGDYAEKPGEEILEEPLLINPLLENPKNHIEIDKLGILHPKNNSIKGKMCIEVFGLNVRLELVELRKNTYDNIINKLNMLIIDFNTTKLSELNENKKGKSPYTIAVRKAIKDFKEEKHKILDTI